MKTKLWDVFPGSGENLQVFLPVGSPGFVDKPWLTIGQDQPDSQELYLTGLDNSYGTINEAALVYARSDDGGDSWVSDVALDSGASADILGEFAPQASIAGRDLDLPLYVSNVKNGTGVGSLPAVYEFYQGDDDASGGTVSFSKLMTASGPLAVTASSGSFEDDIPGSFKVIGPPVILADPRNSRRLYFVYMDHCDAAHNPLEEPCGNNYNSIDIDIKCATIERESGSNFWGVVRIVRVNSVFDPADDEDQFLGGAAVDKKGRIHVVYYDERGYGQPDTQQNNTKWKAFYAYSANSGNNFVESQLQGPNFESEIADFGQVNVVNDELGEYQGIATAQQGSSTVVWMALIGVDPNDLDINHDPKAVFVVRAVHTP